MVYRNLGNSGLKISVFSFGSWLTFAKQIEDKIAHELMNYAYDQGVNFFDNAEIYSKGNSEIVMGKILKENNWDRSSYLVSSKVFFGDGRNKPNQTGLSRKHIVEACHEALRRLQLEYLDLFFCHRPDKSTPIEETVWTMNILIQQGKILYWGTSEWSAQEIMEAHMIARERNLIGPTMEQPQYNMLHREKVEVEFKQLYKNIGLGTTIWSPLASGILTDKYTVDIPKDTRLFLEGLDWLREKNMTEENLSAVKNLALFAKEINISLANLAIGWCITNPNVSSVILGASQLSQLKENLKTLDLLPVFTPELMEQLEVVLKNKPVHPLY